MEDLLSQVAAIRQTLLSRMHCDACARIPQGADPNSIDDGGSPALALAVTNKCPLPLLQALLLAGADPDAAAPTGSPLQVRFAMRRMCGCLIQSPGVASSTNQAVTAHTTRAPPPIPTLTDVSAFSRRRALCLQIAVRNQDVDAVECLLDNGSPTPPSAPPLFVLGPACCVRFHALRALAGRRRAG